jgi:hypothetical protein
MAQVQIATLDPTTGKLPLAVIPDGIVGSSGVDSQARAANVATQSELAAFESSAGLPNGLATLNSNGVVTQAQIQHLIPIEQNADGTWPNRPATNVSVQWLMKVGASNPPVGTGTTAGGVGMVAGKDRLLDATGTLGT